MAKTQKFSEELLTEAVVKYAEVYANKIMPAKLARWASENIPGLEGVCDYHFARKKKIKDKKGRTIEVDKECAKKIQEINEARDVESVIKINPVLSASDINKFFSYTIADQTEAILDARKVVSETMNANHDLQIRNLVLTKENKKIMEQLADLEDRLKGLIKDIEKVAGRQNYLLQILSEENEREKLKEMGISDGEIDVSQYDSVIEHSIEDAMNITKILNQYLGKEEPKDDILSELTDGLFD